MISCDGLGNDEQQYTVPKSGRVQQYTIS